MWKCIVFSELQKTNQTTVMCYTILAFSDSRADENRKLCLIALSTVKRKHTLDKTTLAKRRQAMFCVKWRSSWLYKDLLKGHSWSQILYAGFLHIIMQYHSAVFKKQRMLFVLFNRKSVCRPFFLIFLSIFSLLIEGFFLSQCLEYLVAYRSCLHSTFPYFIVF